MQQLVQLEAGRQHPERAAGVGGVGRRGAVATVAAAAVGAYLGLSERNGSSPLSGAATSAASAPTSAAAPASTTMQDFSGLTQDAATALGHQFNLTVVFDPHQVFDPTTPVGDVVSQQPTFAADEIVQAGSTVTLTLSKGPQTYPIPTTLVGQSVAQATTTLTAANLTLGNQTTDFSATVPAGNIISVLTDPATPLPPGSPVDVDVSKGPAPIAVPDETGKTRTAALADLKAATFTNVTPTFAFNDTVASGHVVSQTPKPPATAQPGDPVTLIVSKGPQLFTVPHLYGLTPAAAKAALAAVNMQIAITDLRGGSNEHVLHQSLNPGDLKPAGTVVTVQIF